jgi:hypothetical protein
MGRKCRTYGREEEYIEGFGRKPLEISRLGMLNNTEKNPREIRWRSMNWLRAGDSSRFS